MLSVSSLRAAKAAALPVRGSRSFSLPGQPRRMKPPVKNAQQRKADQSTSTFHHQPRGTSRCEEAPALLPGWVLSPKSGVHVLLAGNVITALIVMNIASENDALMHTRNYVTSSVHIECSIYHTLVTSTFNHFNYAHLALDMLGIYVFGRRIAPLLGSSRLIGLYVTSGAAASWIESQHQRRMGKPEAIFGANGALDALAALNVCVVPNHSIKVFGLIPVRAWLVAVAWIGSDVFGQSRNPSEGRGDVACASGAALGAVYGLYLRRLMRIRR